MVTAMWNLAARSMAIEMGSKLTNTLKLTGEFEFESYEHFKQCYEDFMNAGFDNVEFFNTDSVMLRPEIQLHLNTVSNKFMDAIDLLNRHTGKEDFDWSNSNHTEDLHHDVTFTLRILGHM